MTAKDGYIVRRPGIMQELRLADVSIALISRSDQQERSHVSVCRCGDDTLCSFKLSVAGALEPLPFFVLLFLGED